MTVPVAGRTACRALASVRSVAARRLCGHRHDIARFAFAPHWLPCIRCPDLMSSDRLPHHRHLRIYAAVSVKRSKPTNDRIVRAKSSKAHHAAWSRRSETSRQPPPICNPLTQNVENIPAQREIIRMIATPFKPGHQPSPIRRNVREPIIRPELQQLERRPVNQRPTMPRHSAGLPLRTPTRLIHTALLPQHIQRRPQLGTRIRLHKRHASPAPQLTGLPPLTSRPINRVEAQQFLRRHRRQRRPTMPRHHGPTPQPEAQQACR